MGFLPLIIGLMLTHGRAEAVSPTRQHVPFIEVERSENEDRLRLVVVVDPRYGNKKDLESLLRWFRATFHSISWVNISIYDDETMAKQARELDKLMDGEKFRNYHRHWVGLYHKEKKAHFDFLRIMPDGADGRIIEVNGI